MIRFIYYFILIICLFKPVAYSQDSEYIRIKRQLITGMNTRGHPTLIGPYQAVDLTNIDLTQLGRNKGRLGYVTKADDLGADNITNMIRFNPSGGSDVILGVEDTNLMYWDGTGDWKSPIKSDLTASDYTLLLVGNNIALVSNGTDNVHSVDYAFSVTDEGDTNTDPPKGTVGIYFKDRFFIAEDGLVYFSDVISTTFDRTTNFFRVNVGDNDAITAILSYREDELIIFKEHSIWQLYVPTNTDPLTNWYLRAVDSEHGCISKNAAIQVGDDIYYWSHDGARTLRRNEQDKVMGITLPVSDLIYEDHVAEIMDENRDKIRVAYYHNRVIFGVPIDDSTYINKWFVYFVTGAVKNNGWAIWETIPTSNFATYLIDDEEVLLFSDGNSNGQMYQMFSGTNDAGATFTQSITTRIENGSEYGLEANKKFCPSLFCRFETEDDTEVTVEAQVDEGGFTTADTIDLDSNAPTLPQPLNFDLTNSNVVFAKIHMEDYGHWFNIQLKFSQSSLDKTFSLLEWVYLLTVDGYEFEV